MKMPAKAFVLTAVVAGLMLPVAASVIPVPVGATNGESSHALKNIDEATTPAPSMLRTIDRASRV